MPGPAGPQIGDAALMLDAVSRQAKGRSLRIALLSYRSDPRVGGQGVFTSNIARVLAARGHAVTVISGPPYPDLPAGVHFAEIAVARPVRPAALGRYALRPRHLLSWTDTAE